MSEKRYDAGDGELLKTKREAEARRKELEARDAKDYKKAAKAAHAALERKVELLGDKLAGAYVAPPAPPERGPVATVELEAVAVIVRKSDGGVEAILGDDPDEGKHGRRAADHLARLEAQVASDDWRGPRESFEVHEELVPIPEEEPHA